MDQAWVTDLVEKLGPRYRLGSPAEDGGVALLHRFGKAEFRPTQVTVGSGEGRRIDLVVDFRIPRDAEVSGSEPLLQTLENESLKPRGFAKKGETTAEMTTESGKASGYVRSVRFEREGTDTPETAKAIRAIVESIDLPVVLGVHEEEHMVARDPRDRPKKLERPPEPMEKWEYTLAGGVLKSLTAVVDPNVRELVIVERKLVSSKEVSEKIMLAHVAKLILSRDGSDVVLSAEKREGDTIELTRSAYKDDFLATVERLAKKVMIPLEMR